MKLLSAFIILSSVEAFNSPEFQSPVSTQLDIAPPYPTGRLSRPKFDGEKLRSHTLDGEQIKEYVPNTFSGFGHAYNAPPEPVPNNSPPEIVPNNSQPRPGFFGAGAQRAKALLSRTKERAYGLREKLRLNRNQNGYENQKWIQSLDKQEEIVKTAELLMFVQEKAARLRQTLRERANQNEYEILQLQVDLKKQERESRSLKKELTKTSNEYKSYKTTAHEEQLALQHTVNYKTDEIGAVEADAKQLCDMLDELILEW
mmetsp:Transcript_23361/g.25751  ORF Transcript_23361/g.25751 Transcript_23361/m.25751 type:complete len:258 (-) Transcript_23361:34-807(-)